MESDFKWWTPPAKPTKKHRYHNMIKSLIEPQAEIRQPVPKLSNEDFSNYLTDPVQPGLFYGQLCNYFSKESDGLWKYIPNTVNPKPKELGR